MKSLAQRSSKLKSPSLEALALRAAADPLLKVQELIQDFIEKLKVRHGGPLVLPPAATSPAAESEGGCVRSVATLAQVRQWAEGAAGRDRAFM